MYSKKGTKGCCFDYWVMELPCKCHPKLHYNQKKKLNVNFLIFASQIHLLLLPVVGAIAAGNCVVIKVCSHVQIVRRKATFWRMNTK